MNIQVVTKSVKETQLFAEKLAKTIKQSIVISLKGDLGAGKTSFTKGFAKGLGIDEIITSPTFTLLNQYDGKEFKLNHFDLYRLSSFDEACELGFEEYFNVTKENKFVTIVEWASNVPEILPKNFIEIVFEKINEDERKIIVKKG